MFTKAGVNVRGARVLYHARVSMAGSTLWRWGFMCQWPTGEVAWGSRSRVCWPEVVRIHSVIRIMQYGDRWPIDLEPAARVRYMALWNGR